MNTNNISYCPVPWTSFSINNNGQYRMCVQANTHRKTRGVCRKDNNEIMTADNASINEARNCKLLKDVRSSMLKGERHPVCQRCNEEEDAGQQSRRVVDRRRYEQRALREGQIELQCPSWEKPLVEDKTLQSFTIDDAKNLTKSDGSIDFSSPILHTDIRLGNLCNLKCRMCGPTESSPWKDDWYNAFGWNRFRHDAADDKYLYLKKDKQGQICIDGFDPYSWHERGDIFNQIVENAPNIEMIHISGGEPTIAKANYELLQKFIDTGRSKRIALDYNTNLVNIPDKAFELWKHFRLVELGGSVDGIKDVNEYIRFPSNWKKIEKTVHKIDQIPNINGWFTTTVQVFNVLNIPELIEWTIEQNFKRFNINGKHMFFSMHHLHNPLYYNIRCLPERIKLLVQSKYESFLERFPKLIEQRKVWKHYENIVDNDYVIDVTTNCLNSILKYMWAQDESYHIREFIDRTEALDKYRSQNFRESLPEIAEPIYAHLKNINYWKYKRILKENSILFKDKHHAIFDPNFQKSLGELPWKEEFEASGFWECKEEFLKNIDSWIKSTKLNKIKGLDKFKQKHIIIGTTQALDESYFRYKDRRLRFYRGEYHYHRRIFNEWEFIDTEYPHDDIQEPIQKNDWVIISMPFCGNGNQVPFLQETLDSCLEKDVPVLIDCAWYGTCYDITIDVNHPAIKEVCFSLSKSLGLGHSRIGIRYSNFTDGTIAVTNDYNHLTLSMAHIANHQMNNFSCDFIPNKYLNWHKELCKEFKLYETKCMHVALGPHEFPWILTEMWDGFEKMPEWKDTSLHFLDDEKYVKIGIREALKARRQGKL